MMDYLPLIDATPRTSQMPLRVGVLVSGRGSNLQALIDSTQGDDCPYIIALVVSNVESAFALERAQAANIPIAVIAHQKFSSRDDFEAMIVRELARHDVELVVLAGFMRVLSKTLLNAYPNRVVNVHPALCPAFPGMHAARQAIDYGVWHTGCTVHLVNEGVDLGAVIAQAIVPVFAEDNEDALQARIQKQEHQLLPKVIHGVAKGRVRIDSGRVQFLDRNDFLGQVVD